MVVRTPHSRSALTILSLFAAITVLTASSCSTLNDDPGTIRVVAPAGKCWSGAIGDSTKDGCGTKTFRITGESIIVGNAQKTTPGRWRLRLELRVKGDMVDSAVTTARFGIAQVTE